MHDKGVRNCNAGRGALKFITGPFAVAGWGCELRPNQALLALCLLECFDGMDDIFGGTEATPPHGLGWALCLCGEGRQLVTS